ncbi:hypothetical protein HDU91_004166 [Kappamyces sp. JEL0680]|nr:hypothetical protein HDU91_004166 [Kappamyces sp. JEL0680]
MNLAFFEFSAGNSVLGLRYMKHALAQWSLISGGDHPDAVSIYANIGTMLQKLEAHDLAIAYLEKALATNAMLSGPESENAIHSHDLLTKAYFLKGDYRKSLAAQQHVYKFCKKTLGDQDERTKSCVQLLHHLTARAVEVAKAERGIKNAPSASLENLVKNIHPKNISSAIASK